MIDEGWLMVCYLGPPTLGAAEVPRVARWTTAAEPHNVLLSPNSRRLMAYLAVPPLRLGSTMTGRALSDALAGALAQPLPRRTTGELLRALELPRQTENRHRRELRAELDALGSPGTSLPGVAGRSRAG